MTTPHAMSNAIAKAEGLPRKCECGGRLVYDRDFGMIFSYCSRCSPVVEIDVSKFQKPLKAIR